MVDPSIGVNQLVTDRKGATTPFDHAEKQGANATAGFTKSLWNGAELIVDGGVRDKKQQGGFFGGVPLSTFNFTYVDAKLQTWSLTPRLSIKNVVFGMPSNILTGIDYLRRDLSTQNRGAFIGAPPIHMYDLSQQTHCRLLAADHRHPADHRFLLWRPDPAHQPEPREICSTRPRPAISATPRPCRSTAAKPSTRCISASSIASTTSSAVFGRAAHAFRTPNVDERVSSGPAFDPVPSLPIPGTSR